VSDVGLIAIFLAAFLFAVGLVQLLDRLIRPGAPDDVWADGPPDSDGRDPVSTTEGTGTSADPGGPR
jgi:hypothetical protein